MPVAASPVPLSLEVKDSKATLLASDDATGTFEALVSVTNIPDHGRDIIEPGAYEQTIKARPHPRVLRGHDWGRRAGKVLQMEEWMPGDWRLPQDLKDMGAGALWIKGQYNLGTNEGREAYSDLKFDPDNAEWSIGYDCSATKSGGPRAWRDPKTGFRHIKSLDLFECSDVVVGMAAGTRALCVKALDSGLLDPARQYSLGELVSIVTGVKEISDNLGDNAGTVGDVSAPGQLGDGVEVGGDEPDSTDDFLGSKSSVRLSVKEWIALDQHFAHRYARKDWTDWDEAHPDRARGESSGGSPSVPGSKPDDDKPPAPPGPPKPPGEPTQPGQTGGGNSGSGSGGGGGDSSSGSGGEGHSGGGGQGGESPVGGLLEQAHNLMDAVREGITEGRERGREWGEEIGEPGPGVRPFGKGLPVLSLKALGYDDDGDDDEDEEGIPIRGQEGDSDDPGVNRGRGAGGYAEPEDANLYYGHDGRHGRSAMKGIRLDPLLPGA